jgi:hypothetical protein
MDEVATAIDEATPVAKGKEGRQTKARDDWYWPYHAVRAPRSDLTTVRHCHHPLHQHVP